MISRSYYSVLNTNRQNQRGIILGLAILTLFVLALAAIVSMQQTRNNMTMSRQSRGKISAAYSADEAINRTLILIRNADPNWFAPHAPTASGGACDTANRLYPYYNPATMDPTTSLTNCEELYTWTDVDNDCTSATVPPWKTFDGGKTICNLLGSTMPNARVAIRGDTPYFDDKIGLPVAPYLVTAVSRNPSGIERMQAAILVPITAIKNENNAWEWAIEKNLTPFLAAKLTLK